MENKGEITMMGQPALDNERAWLLVLLAILALSSLGFAILGLVLGPELAQELELQHRPEVVVIPGAPDLEGLVEFWAEQGFYLLRQEKSSQLQRGNQFSQPGAWLQGQETWVLVPGSVEHKLTTGLWELVGYFLDQGWSMQIEAQDQGYSLGFWSALPGWDQRVLAYVWQLELLTPHNYQVYSRGLLPVLGELFDPQDYLRGTVQSPILAIIIDDWGYANTAVEPLLAYPFPLTMAVLPHLQLSAEVSERAYSRGHEVILHQPMEALNSSLDLGPGGILVEMDPEEKIARLTKNLVSLPRASGLNNHMGSRTTEDPETMTQILQVVKDLGLFFVDSRTSSASVAPQIAQELGVPWGINNLFIDNESDVETIKEQVRKGLHLAKKQGHAIIIGHVRPTTAVALWQMIPEFLTSGVELVPVSSLVD